VDPTHATANASASRATSAATLEIKPAFLPCVIRHAFFSTAFYNAGTFDVIHSTHD
jgi:hypothetical protein